MCIGNSRKSNVEHAVVGEAVRRIWLAEQRTIITLQLVETQQQRRTLDMLVEVTDWEFTGYIGYHGYFVSL